MKHNPTLLVAVPLLLVVSACKEDKPNHTVQYFQENNQARIEALTKCEVMNEASSDANCVNAIEAAQIIAREQDRQSKKDAVRSLYGDGS
ncbi:EexN family lipoprotein [Roseobacter litoralis]|uniref:EexN family lipoprotein n=1 Tax=Roseobacter litoralis TaxID=42443 RepID=UPI002491ACD0|nr:EexN family lipoprotein [Roseobacter litoralis]